MAFDMRNFLRPRRLTMAMWDQAYMLRRNPGDSFADWDRSLEELKERGYNTIRIDAFPGVIDPENPDMEFTWPDRPEQPYLPWCWNREYTCKPGRDLVEFFRLTQEKGIYLTLSSWWGGKDDLRVIPKDTMEAVDLWIKLLAFLKREVGLDNVLFVDLCNEIPGFLPGYQQTVNGLAEKRPEQEGKYLAPAGICAWNPAQLAFMKDTLDSSLQAAQEAFPELRFTYSMNMNRSFEEVGLTNTDVLDIHFFITDQRWDVRTRFNKMHLYDSAEDYKDFTARCAAAAASVGPMLRQMQREQLRWGKAFSEKVGAPLVTTEAWASWFYVDHPDLDWGWLRDWCETAVEDAIEFGLWGMTTCNYVEPHFALWKDVAWHRRLNERFLNS